MEIKVYPKPNGLEEGRGFSFKEIEMGHHWVYADVVCPHCNKLQPLAATHYLGGPCCRCGEMTGVNHV